jgi:hypothetical protein
MDRSRTVSGGHSDNAPLMSSAELPGHDSGDVAMQHVDDTSYSPPMVLSPEIMDSKGGIYTTINTPSSTFDTEDGTYHHQQHTRIKRFDHHEARKSLMQSAALRLLGTLFFSAMMCVTLRWWEGFRHPVALSRVDVQIFNSLTIALSLCLGLNILASLKHYASVVRWSFLTRRYISLEVFDLILHLESLASVTKLMIISSPGFRGKRWLRKFRWFKDIRDDGTKWMWLACLIWLAINLGSQVLVALLSLFWPMVTSELPLLSHGNVTVADLNAWYIDTTPHGNDDGEDFRLTNDTTLMAAWAFGMEAATYPNFTLGDTQRAESDLCGLPGAPIYKGDDAWHYRFFNRAPVRPSSRNITVRATCDQLELLNATVYDVPDEDLYLLAREPGTEDYSKYYMPETALGEVIWVGSVDSYCGPRCTNFTVLQLPYGNVKNASMFLCNNTLGEVTHPDDKDITPHTPADKAALYGSDEFARIATGTIAWTGIPWGLWLDRQTRYYGQGSTWSPDHDVTKQEIEEMLMRFTIGAVAAFDDHGVRYNLTDQNVVPLPGQQLEVDWPYIFAILGGICFIQFLALCLLGLFANRTIVRDDSFFSMAMLLNPVVSRIRGEAAMVMSGDEIKETKALRFKKIMYDYHEGGKGKPNRVAIFFQGEDRRESRRSWAPGSYS